ncbi:MAG: nitronate monooxygenase [Gemmatimonadetes bacterium]|nr:nitronate monooxygenase [Gemmatimonadota bacterium]
MGVAVSDWRLANMVARNGQLGVVSGTALDSVLVRRLQLGDPCGAIRRALSEFPWPDMAQRSLDTFFVPGGKSADESFKLAPLAKMKMRASLLELLVVANFVEVFLAKEGHSGPVGINYLEKIQLPNVPSILGAMLAGVDVVLVGAGIPMAIPGVLDSLSHWETVEFNLGVEQNPDRHSYVQRFDPREYFTGELPELARPNFLAIIASDTLAKTMVKRASGYVNGFVVEHHSAGGHNAPPRRVRGADPDAPPQYGERDLPDLEVIADIGRPFWLAGSNASPEKLAEARAAGAHGIQVGTAFAFSRESGILAEIKHRVLREQKAGTLKVRTDFNSSPTGFPFKVIELDGTVSDEETYAARERMCDLGYLRRLYAKGESNVGYRCPSEPERNFLAKGGTMEDTIGKRCLCNGLLATVGLGQTRDGVSEPPVVTSGDDWAFLPHVTRGDDVDYGAVDVIEYLTRPVGAAAESDSLRNLAPRSV